MELMVIDGNSIMNRAFFGVPPLTTADGLHTHAVHGFLTTLLRLTAQEAPDALCVAFDAHAPTFRHQADPSYKSSRRPMPEELREQMPVVKEVLDALSIPRYELAGWEADDLLGTVSRSCEAAGWDCVVVTGDRDCLQLITEHTRVLLVTTRMGRPSVTDMTEAAFRERYGFDPIHMIDLKALMGDASDDIPGVPGIGEKTATALIQRYGTIDALYDAMPEVDAKPGMIRKLGAGEESARRSYWLATIRTDAPLAFRPEDSVRRAPGAAAYPLFLRLELSKLIERFGLTPPEEDTGEAETFTGTCTTEELGDAEAVSRAVDALIASGEIVDVRASEDLSLVVLEQETADGGRAFVLDADRFDGDHEAALRTLFDPRIPKAGTEVKDLQRHLLDHGCDPGGWIFDAALAGYLLDATAGSYDLDRLCMRYGRMRIGRASDAEGDGQISLDDVDPEKWDRAERQGDLAAEAAAVSVLRGAMVPQMEERGQGELYRTVEMPLCRVLAEMERTGCRVDRDALAAFRDMLSERIEGTDRTVYELAGEEFNIDSPKQLGEILFGKMGLPHGKRTKTGWSTSADVLERLRWEAPIVGAVLDHRQYAKLRSTYAEGLLKAIGPDGRVHTSFQMTVTDTGRLSSRDPNLQNVPVRTDLGSRIRAMFVPDPGEVLVDADWSQIELRILAHVSGDEAMIRAFRQGADIHAATAAQVFRIPPEEVTQEMRRSAKAVNFGLMYGMSAFSLSHDIGVSVAEARAYIDAYFAAFPGVARYMERVVSDARERGWVETLWHRRRDLPELRSSKAAVRAFGERVARNMPIQGTAADLMKLAMVRVRDRLRAEGLSARLVLQVHDELIVECPEAEAERTASVLREEMEGAADLSVPLPAEARWGRDWLEAKG